MFGHSGLKLSEATISSAEVRAALVRLLEAKAFAGADKASRFLQFITEETIRGRSASIKESVIAFSVFGRGSQFDPREDSVVRVEARNVRARLNEYYMTDGRDDPVVIELPKGAYVPAFRSARPSASTSRPAPVRPPVWIVLTVLLAIVCATWLVSTRSPQTPSIAVMPFTTSGGVTAEYLADSFVEDVIGELATVPGLQVASRGSSFQFRDTRSGPVTIGRQLAVASLLRGSIHMDRGIMTVNAELLESKSGRTLWRGHFEKNETQAQAITAELRQAVAAHFALRAAAPRPVRHSPSTEAYSAYLQGRYAISRRQDRKEAAEHYDRAVQADPLFSDAWAALAITRAIMAFHAEGDVEKNASQAREAARHAIGLDPSAHEAHLALALLAYSYDYDWVVSERSFRRALEINRNWAYAHRSYALALATRGAFDAALTALQRAERLDPLSTLCTNERAVVLLCARRYDDAIRTARTHAGVVPDHMYARIAVGIALDAKGQPDESVRQLEDVARNLGRPVDLLGRLGHALARAGRAGDARAIIAEIERSQDHPSQTAFTTAMIYSGLGEKERAVQLLRHAAAAHSSDVVFIAVDPAFDSLRGDPGYRALCARLGLLSTGS